MYFCVRALEVVVVVAKKKIKLITHRSRVYRLDKRHIHKYVCMSVNFIRLTFFIFLLIKNISIYFVVYKLYMPLCVF